ncbi:MAG: bifunctional pyr operon transcriptional regulator/uracil phosphoribosyltransferase PyrR [Armatimonadota bacterium]|nr:MAG: bifunctional pyr operon transcriptional regulator/uracil phosphoribosyltransferase PyrR [Armatimonadota bacterium]
MSNQPPEIMDADDIRRALTRVAHEIIERNRGAENLALVGVLTRGVPLAQRLSELIASIEGINVPVGALDITPYRDDRPDRGPAGDDASDLPFPIDDKRIVLVDEVIYTGRTVRAAMDALMERGRPAAIQLAVLIDRGHRELPVRPDYVGKNVPTSHRERVTVRLRDPDSEERVIIEKRQEGAK